PPTPSIETYKQPSQTKHIQDKRKKSTPRQDPIEQRKNTNTHPPLRGRTTALNRDSEENRSKLQRCRKASRRPITGRNRRGKRLRTGEIIQVEPRQRSCETLAGTDLKVES